MRGSGVRILFAAPVLTGPNRADGIHFIPETWVTLWPRTGLGHTRRDLPRDQKTPNRNA